MAKKTLVPQMFKAAVAYIFTSPATEQYPFIKPPVPLVPDGFRGQPLLDTSLCVGCGLCSKDCPAGAIEMVEVEGQKFPQFRLDKCIFCHQCVESCRRKAIRGSTNFELATTDKSTLTVTPEINLKGVRF